MQQDVHCNFQLHRQTSPKSQPEIVPSFLCLASQQILLFPSLKLLVKLAEEYHRKIIKFNQDGLTMKIWQLIKLKNNNVNELK